MERDDGDHAGFDRRVRDEIARLLHVPVERVTPAASLVDDLGTDSLLHMSMTVGLEQHFDLELPDHEAARFRNVADVIEAVRTCLAGRSIAADATKATGTKR